MIEENKIVLDILNTIKKTINVTVASLHEPEIDQTDITSVIKTLKSGYVSSIGSAINDFEEKLCDFTHSKHAVAIVNGTSALHLALISSGVKQNEEVLVPALTFVGTANSIMYANAIPHFVDSDLISFGVDTKKLYSYLKSIIKMENNYSINKNTGNRIFGIVPVHIFGVIGNIEELVKICGEFNLVIIEDAAEALGSFKNNTHAGLFGKCGCLSFNGNKIITTGGGGAVITNDENVAKQVRHLSQTAKVQHEFEYKHDKLGYNYRMPALNAALGNSQLKKIKSIIERKVKLRNTYLTNFKKIKDVEFCSGPSNSESNYWLNAIQINQKFCKSKDYIISSLNKKGYACRPIWNLMTELPHFQKFPSMNLNQSKFLFSTIINIPSSPFLSDMK